MRTVNIDFLRKRIKKNQKTFLAEEKAIEAETDFHKQCRRAYDAATFAVTHTTDVFSSEIIENVFLKLAREHSIPLPETYNKNTVLHVMTEAYIMGGHTRCVERWIQQFPEHKHSCILLKQKADLPESLEWAVKNGGGKLECCELNRTMLEKALKLRKYASSFEYVVLHIHMDDPISLIAFGTEEFTRPIIFFNHADHAFWLGVSIADYVADLNTNRNILTLEKRGAKNASVLGIPLDNSPLLTVDKAEARKRLGIPENKKVIFSSGQATKYDPIGSPNFYDIISDIVSADSDVVFYIAGAKAEQIFWPELKKKFPKNLILTGVLNYATEYPLYLSAADLVLDSYPVGGETSMIDAVKAGKPVLTMNVNIQADYLINSKACCRSYPEFIEKVRHILDDKSFAEEIYHNVYEKFKLEADPEIWHKKCEAVLAGLPKKHQVYSFKRQALGYDITPFSLETCRWTEPIKSDFKSWLKKIRKSIIRIRLRKHEKIIRICGFYLLNRREKGYGNEASDCIF